MPLLACLFLASVCQIISAECAIRPVVEVLVWRAIRLELGIAYP